MLLKNRPALAFLAFCACTLIWGSTWLAIKIGNSELPPLNGAGLRFTIAAAVLLILQIATRAPMPRNRNEWGVIGFVGVVLIGIDYALIYCAEQVLPTGLTSVLFATMPLFTCILARALAIETLTFRKVAGIMIAIAGVAVLSWEQMSVGAAMLLPALGVLGGALASAATTTVTKKYGKSIHPITLNGWSAAVGICCLYSTALVRGEGLHLPATARGWFAVCYLALGGSVAAFLLYFWLLKHWEATRVGLVSVLTPILAVTLGAVVEGEPVTVWLLLGSALVLGGVFLAMRAPREMLTLLGLRTRRQDRVKQ